MDLTDEAKQDGSLVAEATESTGQAIGQPAEAGEAAVAQFDVLEVVPEPFGRVQVGGVAGETL